MLSSSLPTHLVTYLNSPSFSDIILHSRARTAADTTLPPSPSLPSSSPHLHNSNIAYPLRHSQSLTLPPPSYSPSFSATAASSPSSDPRLSPLFPASLTSPLSSSPSSTSFSLDDDRFFHCHRVVLAGRSPFWCRLLISLTPDSTAALPSFTASYLSSQPLISLIPPSSTSSLSSDPTTVELSLLVHPDALFVLLKYVYSGKADLSFMEHRAAQHDHDDLNTAPTHTTAAFAFTPSALTLSLSQADYHSVLIQQLLFYSQQFELHSLYSMLVQHFCTVAPRQLQLHLHSIQAIKADIAFETISSSAAATTALKQPSSSSFLSMSLLQYGQHDVARGVHVRIASSASSTSSLSSSLVELDGGCWRRYKVDPLVFACRSAFFSAMFNADWKENQWKDDHISSSSYKDDVVLQDMSQLEFEHLLQFLYTDEMWIEGGADGRSEGRMGGSPFLKRSMQHLAIDNPHTRALLTSSPSFAHLVSLLSFAVLYAIPSLTEYLQHLLYQHVTPDTVCAIWPLVLNTFFSPSATLDTALSPSFPLASSSFSSPTSDFFTDLDILHEGCVHYSCQHFLRISHHPSFLHLPLPLLKQTLDPGTVECDSTGMVEALERWMEARVRREGVVVGGVEEASRKSELRLCLFPPSTLFNRSEKSKVLTGDTALFRRLGWIPQMRG